MRLLLPFLILVLGPGALLAQNDDDPYAERRKQRQGPPRSWEEKWTTDPNKADKRWQAAARHRFAGHVEEAMALYRTFLEEDANEISVVVSMGTAYWELGDFANAEKWFRKGIEMVPRQIKARQFLGQLLFFQGRFQDAKKEFQELIDLKYDAPEVTASAQLNLAKIMLVEGKYRKADRMFYKVGKSPERGDRASAERGRFMAVSLKEMKYWVEEKTKSLTIRFAPDIPGVSDANWRKEWAAAREAAWTRMAGTVGLTFPDKIPVYVFADAMRASGLTKADELPTWKYSWWLCCCRYDSPPGSDLGFQIAARAAGSRPTSKPLVAGFVAWLDSDESDPHAGARKRLAEGRLAGIVHMHANQRFDLAKGKEYGESLVAFIIEKYGLEGFLKIFRNYNLVMLDPAWIDPATKIRRWEACLSEIFRRGTGKGVAALEAEWKAYLGK